MVALLAIRYSGRCLEGFFKHRCLKCRYIVCLWFVKGLIKSSNLDFQRDSPSKVLKLLSSCKGPAGVKENSTLIAMETKPAASDVPEKGTPLCLADPFLPLLP